MSPSRPRVPFGPSRAVRMAVWLSAAWSHQKRAAAQVVLFTPLPAFDEMDGSDGPSYAFTRGSRSFLDVAAVAEAVAELTVDELSVADVQSDHHVFVPDIDDICARGQVRANDIPDGTASLAQLAIYESQLAGHVCKSNLLSF